MFKLFLYKFLSKNDQLNNFLLVPGPNPISHGQNQINEINKPIFYKWNGPSPRLGVGSANQNFIKIVADRQAIIEATKTPWVATPRPSSSKPN